MSVELECRKVIDSLIESAEATTGESYTNLTEAHQALKNGYGQGAKEEMTKTVVITENGSSTVIPDEGKALSEVIIYTAVKCEEVKLETETTVDITENGTTEIVPEEGETFSKVTVTVNVDGGNEEPLVGITDFTDFWSSGKNMAVYDKVDTSEGVIFDKLLYSNKTIDKLPKYLKITNKATSLAQMFYGCHELKELPEIFDTSNCTNFEDAFRDCGITDLSKINTSNGVNFSAAFYRQYGANQVILPDVVDMANATTGGSMCYGASIKTFPFINTGKVTTFRNAFYSCQFTEADLDLTSCTDMRSTFGSCTKLKTLTLRNAQQMTSRYFEVCFISCTALENFDIDTLNIMSNHLDFSACTKLTVESIVNILNALSDNIGVATTYTVKIGSTNLAKLSMEQKSIALNKNIELT